MENNSIVIKEFENPPIILAMGKTGSGKSTLLNKISGNTANFTESNFLRSQTEHYEPKLAKLGGFPDGETVILYDSIGYEDNRGLIKETFFEETCRFLISLKTGVNVVLMVISLSESSRLNTKQIFDTMNLLGPEVVKNMLIVFTQGNTLCESLARKRKNDFQPENVIAVLEEENIFMDSNQIIFFDNTEEDLRVLQESLINFIQEKGSYMPLMTYCLMDMKKALEEKLSFQTEEDLLFMTLLYSAELDDGLKKVIRGYFDECDEIVRKSLRIEKQYGNGLKQPDSVQDVEKSRIGSVHTLIANPKQDNGWVIIENTDEKKSFYHLEEKEVDGYILPTIEFNENETRYKKLYGRVCFGIKVAMKSGIIICSKQCVAISTKIGNKVLTKAIPFVGLVTGVVFGIFRLYREKGWKNKFVKCGVEMISGGFASLIPVAGPAASIGLDTTLQVWDEVETDDQNVESRLIS